MFGKENATAVDDGQDTGRGEIGLAYVNGCQAFAVVGRNLRVMAAGSVGCTVQYETLRLPSGRVIALGSGPSVMMADGGLHFWQSGRWNKVGNLLDGPQP